MYKVIYHSKSAVIRHYLKHFIKFFSKVISLFEIFKCIESLGNKYQYNICKYIYIYKITKQPTVIDIYRLFITFLFNWYSFSTKILSTIITYFFTSLVKIWKSSLSARHPSTNSFNVNSWNISRISNLLRKNSERNGKMVKWWEMMRWEKKGYGEKKNEKF